MVIENWKEKIDWEKLHKEAKEQRREKILEFEEKIKRGKKLTPLERDLLEMWAEKYGKE